MTPATVIPPMNAKITRSIAERLAREWHLALGAVLPGATCSLVLEAGDDLVLKVPEPHAEEARALPTLRAFSSHGGVKVLRADELTGAVLMPRLRPGNTLAEAELDDLERVDVCARVIQSLRGSPLVDAPPLEADFVELQNGSSPLAKDAFKTFVWLAESTTRRTLLHGDLHHFNLLHHAGSWVAIDPKGVIGDPAHEVTGFMRNPVAQTPDAEGMAARLRRFADRLGDPPDRLWGWSFAQTVLCATWGGIEGFADGWWAAAEALAECRQEFR